MANASRTTANLNIQTSLFNSNDRLVVLYGADTINTSNSVAQTATIPATDFFPAVANLISIPVQQTDPANSTALTIQGGSIFASNSYLYIANANNHLLRIALGSF